MEIRDGNHGLKSTRKAEFPRHARTEIKVTSPRQVHQYAGKRAGDRRDIRLQSDHVQFRAGQVVTDPPGIAHATGGDDHVVSVKLVDRLALIDGFREAHILRGQSAFQDIPVVYLSGVFPENSACSGCKR